MATLLAPYNSTMRLGTGFNSFTQQMCVDNAVIRDTDRVSEPAPSTEDGQVAQMVSYRTSVIDKVTDVTNAMNINAAFSIKYDTLNAQGKGDFINTSKIKESDASFLISVKVVNQVINDHSLTQFNAISGVKPSSFAEVYGDSFISGYQEGGEFTAVISVKGKDQDASERIKLDAAISFTKDKFEGSLEGAFGKTASNLMKENETTISVVWSGGGQHLKERDQDWTLETMKKAALKFPELVAKTPVRTHAVLTKYTALRSFYSANQAITIPSFERAGIYCNMLQEVYLDYKTIVKDLQCLAYDVAAGVSALQVAEVAEGDKASGPGADGTVPSSETYDREGPSDAVKKPYPATLQGLESAKNYCRIMLARIAAEVDIISRDPDAAVDEKRKLPYMSPFVFKSLVPKSKKVTTAAEAEAEPGKSGMTDQLGSAVRRF